MLTDHLPRRLEISNSRLGSDARSTYTYQRDITLELFFCQIFDNFRKNCQKKREEKDRKITRVVKYPRILYLQLRFAATKNSILLNLPVICQFGLFMSSNKYHMPSFLSH